MATPRLPTRLFAAGVGSARRPGRARQGLEEAAFAAAWAAGQPALGGVPGARGRPVLVTMDRSAQDGSGVAYVNAAVVQAMLAAGGDPWLLPAGHPAPDEALDGVVAVVITGGAHDIHPRHYGQAQTARVDAPDEPRTTAELAVARAAIARGLPVLGLCGGLQVLAVATGGSLIQDLPAVPGHEQGHDPASPAHAVRLEGALARFGTRLAVNSTHHQAIDDPGALTVCGWSDDGVAEAAVGGGGRLVGVQWHPELLADHRWFCDLLARA